MFFAATRAVILADLATTFGCLDGSFLTVEVLVVGHASMQKYSLCAEDL